MLKQMLAEFVWKFLPPQSMTMFTTDPMNEEDFQKTLGSLRMHRATDFKTNQEIVGIRCDIHSGKLGVGLRISLSPKQYEQLVDRLKSFE